MTTHPGDPVPPTRIYRRNITDSRLWEHFVPRSSDVIVSTPPKSGTTWMQGVLALLFSGDPGVDAKPTINAPWFDARLSDTAALLQVLEAQTNRRQIKTHTPLDGVPMWDALRYITVYRHPIDVHFSARKHVANYTPEIAAERGISKDNFPDDPRESFRIFLARENDEDHGSLKLIVKHYLATLEAERRPNLLRLHYADMTRDLADAMQKVAQHIGVSHPRDVMDTLVEAARFNSMKKNADRFALAQGKGVWRNDAGFFDSATSNKWDGILTDEDLAAYDKAIDALLSPEQRHWLEWGSV